VCVRAGACVDGQTQAMATRKLFDGGVVCCRCRPCVDGQTQAMPLSSMLGGGILQLPFLCLVS
jgi:hypothetical protein